MLPQIFNYQDNQIRVIMLDGQPWWVAKDVCDILQLQYHRSSQSFRR